MASTDNYCDTGRDEQTFSADNFLSNLERLIESKGLTSADVARKCGLTPTMVYNWRQKKSEPSLYSFTRLCMGLGVEPNWLLSKHEPIR